MESNISYIQKTLSNWKYFTVKITAEGLEMDDGFKSWLDKNRFTLIRNEMNFGDGFITWDCEIDYVCISNAVMRYAIFKGRVGIDDQEVVRFFFNCLLDCLKLRREQKKTTMPTIE